MLRAIFTIGLFAVLGLLALKIVFGIFGPLILLFLWMLKWAVIIGFFGFIVYLILRLVSPGTAQRIRDRWSGSSF